MFTKVEIFREIKSIIKFLIYYVLIKKGENMIYSVIL